MAEDRQVVGEVAVYVWGGSSWTRNDRLVPQSSETLPSAQGSATFALVRGVRRKSDQTESSDPLPAVGDRVAITNDGNAPDGSGGYSTSNVLWFGEIYAISKTPVAGDSDFVGTVSAVEFGVIWDRNPLRGWQRYVSTSTSQEISRVPTANIKQTGGGFLGNAKALTSGPNSGVYVFANTLADCGTANANIWNRNRLIEHVAAFCLPSGNWDILLSTYPVAWDTEFTEEVFDIDGLTLTGFLNLVASAARGYEWWIEYDGTTTTPSVVLRIKQVDTAANTPTDITITDRLASSPNLVDVVPYDQVVVEGAPVVYCGTISYQHGLTDGWSATALTEFQASSAADEQEAREIRRSPQCRDVFVRYDLEYDGSGNLVCRDASNADQALCPSLDFSSSSGATISGSQDWSPDGAMGRIMRNIPWYSGVKYDGTDSRDADAAKAGNLETVRVFRDNGSESAWWDLLAPPEGWDTPRVSPDERALAVRIEYPYPEVLAASWSASYGPTPKDPDNLFDSPEAGSWQNLYVTLAVQGSKRLEVTKTRTGVTNPVRRLVVRRPDYKVWVVRAGTILSVQNDTEGEIIADSIERDDSPAAHVLADELAEWAFANRTYGTLEFTRPDQLRDIHQLGYMIGSVTISLGDGRSDTYTLNTMVSRVTRTYGSQPRVTITTAPPPAPGGGGASASPSSGGTVSVALQGTPAQAVQGVAEKADEERAAVARLPMVEAAPSGGFQSQRSKSVISTATATGLGTASSVGDGLYISGSNYTRTPSASAKPVGIVSEVIDADTVAYQSLGAISGLSGLTSGAQYYFDQSQAGPPVSTLPVLRDDEVSSSDATLGPWAAFVATSTTTASVDVYRWQVGAESTVRDINKTSHGMSVGNVVKQAASGTLQTARADSASNAQPVGVVSAVADANNLSIVTGGLITGLSGLTAGQRYYLSQATAGLLTSTRPTTGEVVHILDAISSSAGYVNIWREPVVDTVADTIAHDSSSAFSISTSTPSVSRVSVTVDNSEIAEGEVFSIKARFCGEVQRVTPINAGYNGDYGLVWVHADISGVVDENGKLDCSYAIIGGGNLPEKDISGDLNMLIEPVRGSASGTALNIGTMATLGSVTLADTGGNLSTITLRLKFTGDELGLAIYESAATNSAWLASSCHITMEAAGPTVS